MNIFNYLKQRKLATSVRVLGEAIQKDPSYYEVWESHIAMTIYDHSRGPCSSRKISAQECNEIAVRLMKALFNAPPTERATEHCMGTANPSPCDPEYRPPDLTADAKSPIHQGIEL
jgi:hypothetical protein